MNKYRKKQLIELIKVLPNGDRLVQNEGNSNDQWVIPKEIFEKTYERVLEIW